MTDNDVAHRREIFLIIRITNKKKMYIQHNNHVNIKYSPQILS